LPHIRTEGLHKTYWLDEINIQSLIDINLSIEQGEFVAITGPSGSGKSTLLHILGCIDTPTTGTVFINDKNVSTMRSNALRELRLRELGFVFQHFYLLPVLTAKENIELPMNEADCPKGSANSVLWNSWMQWACVKGLITCQDSSAVGNSKE
jgi:putative ABC transport system ATP-binding protein